jgi:hypothetical protein
MVWVPCFRVTAIAQSADIPFELDSVPRMVRLLKTTLANDAGGILLTVEAPPRDRPCVQLLGANAPSAANALVDPGDVAREVILVLDLYLILLLLLLFVLVLPLFPVGLHLAVIHLNHFHHLFTGIIILMLYRDMRLHLDISLLAIELLFAMSQEVTEAVYHG